MGKSTISMVIFHSFLYVYQRVLEKNGATGIQLAPSEEMCATKILAVPFGSIAPRSDRDHGAIIAGFLPVSARWYPLDS